MANVSGGTYGLTILSPIREDEHLGICHAMQLRWYLSNLPRDYRSPFAQLSSSYLARLVVMDDVVFVGLPACEEHLKSRYLVFESNFDGDLDTYLRRMATETQEFVDAVWGHCVGFPGVQNVDAFVSYMKRCQVRTTFFFADVNNATVSSTLKALRTQSELARFYRETSRSACRGTAEQLREISGEVAKLAFVTPGRRRIAGYPAGESAA